MKINQNSGLIQTSERTAMDKNRDVCGHRRQAWISHETVHGRVPTVERADHFGICPKLHALYEINETLGRLLEGAAGNGADSPAAERLEGLLRLEAGVRAICDEYQDALGRAAQATRYADYAFSVCCEREANERAFAKSESIEAGLYLQDERAELHKALARWRQALDKMEDEEEQYMHD